MRPQDRDGSNNNHVGERGRSQQIAPSRGRSRDRSYDVSSRHRYDDRDMRRDATSDHYHRSRSIDHVPHRSHRSRSLDTRNYNYPSTSNSSFEFERNSSDSRKRPRSPDRRHRNNDRYDRSSHPKSFDDGRPKDARSYERYQHASTRGAEKHRAPANALYRHENAENYANESYGNMSNMSNYQSHYYQPQSRYEHSSSKGTSTSHERHPLAPRYSSNPALQQRNLPHFNSIQTIPELIQTAHANITILTPSSIAAFWSKMSKLMSGSGSDAPNSLLPNRDEEELGSYLHRIFEHTQNTLSQFCAKYSCQTIYSMAKLVHVLRKNNGRRRGSEEDIVDALSRLLLNSDSTPKKELFHSLACATRGKLDKFDARGLSNLSYAYALVRNVPNFDDGSDLFDLIAAHAAIQRAEFNAQDISNMVWAYATAGKPHPLLFDVMGDEIAAFKHLGEFKPQDLSNTVWAYASAGVHHSKLFEKIANHVIRLDVLYGFKPQNLSNTVWAYAKAGINHPKMFEKIANHIVQSDILDRFNPQDFSNTVWAYATAGVDYPALFEKVANHIVESDSLKQFKQQELSNTVWAFTTAQVSHLKLFKKVAKTAIQSKEELVSQGVANLLWAYATMGIIDKQLFSSFESTAAKLIDSYNNQNLANIAWAYAVADVEAPTLFDDSFISKCVEKKDGLVVEELSQLCQWHLWQAKEKSNPGLPEELAGRCHEAFISAHPQSSRLQDDVVAQLSSIGLDPKEEVLMDSGYRIDAIVEVNGKTIGIEVDGPHHFIGRSKSPLARTILKRRQVPLIDGIELVSVPYWEWRELGKDRVKEQEYLRNLLDL